MRIAHFSTTDILGGAAQATYKLHLELIRQGVESTMLVKDIVSQKPIEVKILKRKNSLYENKIKPRIQKLAYQEYKKKYKVPKHITFSWNTLLPEYDLNIPEINEADIIALYWVGEFLSPEIIGQFKQPIVWRLSDIWPFSGGCHYPGDCKNFKTGCGNCHYFQNFNNHDFSYKLNKRKQEVWKELDITIAAPSNWIAKLAAESTIFENRKIEVIKTGVDHNKFKPIDKNLLRESFNISKDKIMILFGADSSVDERKGFKYLTQALKNFSIQNRKNIVLGIFGSKYDKNIEDLGYDIHYFGYVNETFLPIIYNLTDIFIAPSIEENLPNTVLEAMSCGIPCVSFKIGGMPDIIKNEKNGCMAKAKDSDDLFNCIQYTLENKERLGINARNIILNNFTQEKQANNYIKLYNSILNK
jgi:glycosyltransferase involved in cell wall biosynthesis